MALTNLEREQVKAIIRGMGLTGGASDAEELTAADVDKWEVWDD